MEAVKKYIVSANKSSYFSDSFDTADEAIQVASRLINEGYAMVTVRDNETEGDIW